MSTHLMWYFIAGNIMSSLTFTCLINFLNNVQEFKTFNCTICWFFIEHICEEYSSRSGKFFFIKDDFRTLVRNCLLIIRNFTFLAQAFNPLEFIVINLVLISTIIIYQKKTLKHFVRAGVLICYYVVFQSFLLCNDYVLFLMAKNLLYLRIFIMSFSIYFFIIFLCLTEKTKVFKPFQFVFIKTLFYFIFSFCCMLFCFIVLTDEFKLSENFFQEFCLNCLITYVLIYVIIF